MKKTFVAAREDRPGSAWLERFQAGREEAERWYRDGGHGELPTAVACRDALRQHMPELVPHYDDACGMVGDDGLAHRIISHYRAISSPGCSQAVWLGEGGPALVRNYDYPLDKITGRIELTRWSGRRVIAMVQRPWGGCLDGINEDGLVASCTLGVALRCDTRSRSSLSSRTRQAGSAYPCSAAGPLRAGSIRTCWTSMTTTASRCGKPWRRTA